MRSGVDRDRNTDEWISIRASDLRGCLSLLFLFSLIRTFRDGRSSICRALSCSAAALTVAFLAETVTAETPTEIRVATAGFYIERPAGFSDENITRLAELLLSRVNEHYAAVGLQLQRGPIVAVDAIPGNTSFMKLKHTVAAWSERSDRPDVVVALVFGQAADMNVGLSIPDSSCGSAPNVVLAAIRATGPSPETLSRRQIAEAGDTIGHELAHTLGIAHTTELCEGSTPGTLVGLRFTLMHPRAQAETCSFSNEQKKQLVEALASPTLGGCYDTVAARLAPSLQLSISGPSFANEGDAPILTIDTSVPTLVRGGEELGEHFPLVNSFRLRPIARGTVQAGQSAATLSLRFEAATFFGKEEASHDIVVSRVDGPPQIFGTSMPEIKAPRGRVKMGVVYASDPDGEQVGFWCRLPRRLKMVTIVGTPYSAAVFSGRVSRTTAVACVAFSGTQATPFFVVVTKTKR